MAADEHDVSPYADLQAAYGELHHRVERLTAPLQEIAVDVVLADDLTIEGQVSALWGVVRRHTAIAKEALDAR